MTDSGSMTNPSEALWTENICINTAAIAAEAYFARCSKFGAVIALDSLNDERREQVLDCFRAAIEATQAATPAAPVQDDDAEFLLDLALTMNDIEAAAVRRIAARLTPDRATPLVEALRSARGAIASLPEDALGHGDYPCEWTGDALRYPIRDELLSNIDSALRDGGFDA